jgi:phosphoribosylamine-glycine ligase
MAPSLEAARKKAYDGIAHIKWEDAYYRKDIGMDLLKMI